MYGRISAAPSEQLMPTASGRTWRTEFQNASVVCPDNVRPEASVIVPETITGKRRPIRSKNVSSAKSAAFPFSVSKIVSTRKRSAPPSASPSIASPYEATSSSKRTLRAPGSLTSGEIDAVRLVGTERAGDEARLVGGLQRPGVGALAREPRRRDVDLAHAALEPIVGLRDRRRVERVGAR